MVEIQIQDHGGNRVTVSNVVDNLQRVGFELRLSIRDIQIGGLGPLIATDD